MSSGSGVADKLGHHHANRPSDQQYRWLALHFLALHCIRQGALQFLCHSRLQQHAIIDTLPGLLKTL